MEATCSVTCVTGRAPTDNNVRLPTLLEATSITSVDVNSMTTRNLKPDHMTPEQNTDTPALRPQSAQLTGIQSTEGQWCAHLPKFSVTSTALLSNGSRRA